MACKNSQNRWYLVELLFNLKSGQKLIDMIKRLAYKLVITAGM